MAFEKITKGDFELHKHSKTTAQRIDGRTVASCAGYSTNTDNGEHVCENEANAEFIAFAFNLQQKLDIGVYEEVVYLLVEMIDSNLMGAYYTEKIQQVLTKAKRQ